MPLIAVAAVDSLDEAFTLANDTPLGLTAGMFSTDAGRGRRVPRPDRGRRRLHQPAGRRDDRAPGPACSRSAVGRARGRTARRAAARTTCSSTFASRAERWWVHDQGRGRTWRTATAPTLVTELPGPKAAAVDRARPARHEPVDGSRVPTRARTRASGLVIEDVDGNRFLDFNAGIAVTSTGHCHPAVVDAISTQAGRLIHYCSSDFYPPVYAELSERLVAARADRGREQGLPHQLGDRSGRGVDQARAPRDRPAVRDRVPRRVPRPEPRQPLAHREQGEVPAGLQPAAPGRAPRAVRRRRLHRGRAVQAPRHARRGRGRDRRADPGRGRLHRPARGVARPAAGAVRPARDPVRRRRDPERDRPDRASCGRSSTRASSRTSCCRARASRAACRSARSSPDRTS